MPTIARRSNTNQHAHPSSPLNSIIVDAHAPAGSIVHSHANANHSVRGEVANLEMRIGDCEEQMISIRRDLLALDNKEDARQVRTRLRCARERARANSSSNIKDKLKPEYFARLISNIQNKNSVLDKQCASLIRRANDGNYAKFLQKMDFFLSGISMPEIEKDALRTIVRLMNQCSIYDGHAQGIQSELTALMATIHRNQAGRIEQVRRLDSLNQANPELKADNERLLEENRVLELTRAQNILERDKLSMPSLILLASSLVASTPLILTLTGVIPPVLTPALLFTLVSFPPALLAVATLIVGIMALTYAVRGHRNKSNIESNQSTIDGNSNTMQKNAHSIASLQQTVIPLLERQISEDICRQQELATQLERTQALSRQLLMQATNIEPIRASQSPSSLLGHIPSAPPAFEVLGDFPCPPPYS